MTPTNTCATAAAPVSAPSAPARNAFEEEEDARICVVCFEAARSHACVPCGHWCMCEGCSDALFSRPEPSCPLCRADVVAKVRIYV